jgi:hypothetical protein
MSRHRILAIATACACCAVPAAVLAAKPAPTTVTIGIAPVKVTFGKSAVVSGTTAANTSVTLRADAFPFDGNFSQVTKANSNATGAYSFTVTPDSSTHYRADVKQSNSPVVALAVRWKVTRTVSTRTPKKGSRVLFSGTVSPAHTGGTAKIQRRNSSGVYRTVKTTTLAAASPTSSSYSVRVRVRRTGRYRVQVDGDGAHETGNSRSVKLTVH